MNILLNIIISFCVTAFLFIGYDNNPEQKPRLKNTTLTILTLLLFVMQVGFWSTFGNFGILDLTTRFLISNQISAPKIDANISTFSNIKNNSATSAVNQALNQL